MVYWTQLYIRRMRWTYFCLALTALHRLFCNAGFYTIMHLRLKATTSARHAVPSAVSPPHIFTCFAYPRVPPASYHAATCLYRQLPRLWRTQHNTASASRFSRGRRNAFAVDA